MVRKRILEVPKIKQLKRHCGPASLAMVLQYYGANVSQEEIAEYCGGKEEVEANGIDYMDLVRYARKQGFIAYIRERMGLEDIIRNIDKGIPILTKTRSNEQGYTHIEVIKGYRLDPNILFINDPLLLREDRILYSRYTTWWRVRQKGRETNHLGICIRKRN